MSLPEWGYSYNALCVPLTSDWQCSLVPVSDVEDVDRGWTLSFEERQKARKQREETIEQDRKDFNRFFRTSIRRCHARACRDFSAYAAFIGEHLRISGLSAPVDGEDVTRILRDAVRDGRIVPAIDRAWRGSRRVARFYAPQSWPKRTPDPKPTVYGVHDGQFVPLDENGCFVDRTAYVPFAVRAAATVSNAAGSRGGTGWPRAVDVAAGAVLGAYDSDGNELGSDTRESRVFSDDNGDTSTRLGDAQPFNYQPDLRHDDAFDIAKTPNEGEPGTWYTNPGSGQMRLYGGDGKAVVDFDFDHDHGQGVPHSHNWESGVRGPGVPFSLLP
ncbi:hypothetical protein ACLKMY_23300 [Paraburkholderia mimosarum]|uniref:hypothetical protein n=1 Tax=Paraburkholderia mimosarum TaxID=312026 RepID=UPI0039C3AA72